MPWDVEFTDEFEQWWNTLSYEEQRSISRVVYLLEQEGPQLLRPYADTIQGSKYANLRELRIQHEGCPYRVLYVFDPRRVALLLVGGDKTGNERWYEEMIPQAERIYEEHLREIKKDRKE